MSTLEPRRLAGQLLITGFDGDRLSDATREALARGERAGCILFKRNLPTLEATAALTASIVAAAREADSELEPIVAIDEEGGRVSRLPSPFVKLPPMRELGRIDDLGLTRRAGHAVGAVLRGLGFNLDFAPILDVDSNPANPIIGDRSFSHDPAAATAHALAFAAGLGDGGVLACGKHFPGHGDTDLDSHLALPRVAHPRERLDRVELAPFAAAARAGIDSIMSAHVVIEALDRDRPATLCRSAMTTLLRDELGFRGVLVSDDLEMRAVADLAPVETLAVGAIEAGCDVLLVCREEALADRAIDALAAAIERDPKFRGRCEQAAARMRSMRLRAAELAKNAACTEAPTMGAVHEAIRAAGAVAS
jgi:beta-N-acetylhexosaminidase